jgi:hypothetical protein
VRFIPSLVAAASSTRPHRSPDATGLREAVRQATRDLYVASLDIAGLRQAAKKDRQTILRRFQKLGVLGATQPSSLQSRRRLRIGRFGPKSHGRSPSTSLEAGGLFNARRPIAGLRSISICGQKSASAKLSNRGCGRRGTRSRWRRQPHRQQRIGARPRLAHYGALDERPQPRL